MIKRGQIIQNIVTLRVWEVFSCKLVLLMYKIRSINSDMLVVTLVITTLF